MTRVWRCVALLLVAAVLPSCASVGTFLNDYSDAVSHSGGASAPDDRASGDSASDGGAPPGNAPSASAGGKLMIFGGQNNKTYLGCLSCDAYAGDSIFNESGNHGSPYSTESIANHLSEFGSSYSNYSACSTYATEPPVIVDGAGKFYGRLTANAYHAQRTRNQSALAWLAAACGS